MGAGYQEVILVFNLGWPVPHICDTFMHVMCVFSQYGFLAECVINRFSISSHRAREDM